MGGYFSTNRDENLTFQLISDLHLEFFDNLSQAIEILNLQIADENYSKFLIICGDVCALDNVSITLFEDFFQYVSLNFKQIIYIAGNHEYYGLNFADTIIEIKNRLVNFPNVIFLEKEHIKIGKLTILGTTLWTSPNRMYSRVFNNFSNDFKCIKNKRRGKILPSDFTIEHNNAVEFIQNCLNNLGPDEKALIITHHVPGFPDVLKQHVKAAELLSLYGSDMISLLRNNRQRIVLWCCGHCHRRIRRKIGGVSIVSNPFGYYNLGSDRYNNEFNSQQVFSV
eukprot:TRINITY_DN588_c0_g1_i1.p1 TRINITY_DN588_c0_g1~~TRINITY_DN588_c0_g1_i1.p1  ORF type:complete len:281 (-),score=63.89 TRINITY_DN588_c0_g1_i1:65-907(-)